MAGRLVPTLCLGVLAPRVCSRQGGWGQVGLQGNTLHLTQPEAISAPQESRWTHSPIAGRGTGTHGEGWPDSENGPRGLVRHSAGPGGGAASLRPLRVLPPALCPLHSHSRSLRDSGRLREAELFSSVCIYSRFFFATFLSPPASAHVLSRSRPRTRGAGARSAPQGDPSRRAGDFACPPGSHLSPAGQMGAQAAVGGGGYLSKPAGVVPAPHGASGRVPVSEMTGSEWEGWQTHCPVTGFGIGDTLERSVHVCAGRS